MINAKINNINVLSVANNGVRVVTHDGLCHADELLAIALIWAVSVNPIEIIRTRDESLVQDGDIVLDVFNTSLDHHDRNSQVVEAGRTLAAAGLTWRWVKDLAMSRLGIDEDAWVEIDQSIIKSVDHTDNTGEMNPLNYAFNGIVKSSNNFDEAFEKCLGMMKDLISGVIKTAAAATADRKAYAELPEKKINGKRIKISDRYLNITHSASGEAGFIFPSKDPQNGDHLTVKVFTAEGNTLSKPGIKSGEIEGVIFSHPNGFLGKVKTLSDLAKII